jgi:hypothetical protein
MVAASFHYSEQQVKPEKANKQTNKHIQNLWNQQDRQLCQKLVNCQPSIYSINHLLTGLKNVDIMDYTVSAVSLCQQKHWLKVEISTF